jgi:hypothetical protein
MNLKRLFRRSEPLQADKDGIKRWLWPSVTKPKRGKREVARRKRQIERGMIKAGKR